MGLAGLEPAGLGLRLPEQLPLPPRRCPGRGSAVCPARPGARPASSLEGVACSLCALGERRPCEALARPPEGRSPFSGQTGHTEYTGERDANPRLTTRGLAAPGAGGRTSAISPGAPTSGSRPCRPLSAHRLGSACCPRRALPLAHEAHSFSSHQTPGGTIQSAGASPAASRGPSWATEATRSSESAPRVGKPRCRAGQRGLKDPEARWGRACSEDTGLTQSRGWWASGQARGWSPADSDEGPVLPRLRARGVRTAALTPQP